jgi:hypothetical protein
MKEVSDQMVAHYPTEVEIIAAGGTCDATAPKTAMFAEMIGRMKGA